MPFLEAVVASGTTYGAAGEMVLCLGRHELVQKIVKAKKSWAAFWRLSPKDRQSPEFPRT